MHGISRGCGCAWLTCVTKHITQQCDDYTAWIWYASHPRAALSVISTPKAHRNVCRRLPSLEHGDIIVTASVSHRGVRLNGSDVIEPLQVAVAQVSLVAALLDRLVKLTVDSKSVEATSQLLVLLHRSRSVRRMVQLTELRVTGFGALLRRLQQSSGQWLDMLRTLRCLVLSDARDVDIPPILACELVMLKTLHIPRGKIFSLLVLRGMETLQDIDVSVVPITHGDMVLISQMAQLCRLVVDGCAGVISLNPLAGHPSLRYLSAAECINLRSVGSLNTIPNLEHVNLSGSAVSPSDLWRCVRGLAGIRELYLDGSRLGDTEERTEIRWERLRFLSLRGLMCRSYTWAAAAVCLSVLLLDSTRIDERELSLLCSSLIYLERLSITKCTWLVTSLASVLTMKYIREVAISRRSLRSDSAVVKLRQRGVQCRVCTV